MFLRRYNGAFFYALNELEILLYEVRKKRMEEFEKSSRCNIFALHKNSNPQRV